MNFQEIVMRLEHFWASQGCVVQQPYDLEVGAGTMNPATTLRVLGPEPWRVAYVEPSRRPTDGRYGEKHAAYVSAISPDASVTGDKKVSYYNGEYNKLCLDGGLDDANGFYSTYGTLRLRGDETSYMLQAGPRRRQYPPFRLQGGQARCERHEHGGQ